MSICIPRKILTKEHAKEMDKKLMITPESTKKSFNKNFHYQPPKIPFFQVFHDNVHVPFSWGLQYFQQEEILKKKEFSPLVLQFTGTLRPEQLDMKQNAIDLLQKNNACLMAVYPGGGKTITSVDIISEMKVATLIIVNKVVLIEQWKETIQQYLHIDPFVIGGKNCKLKSSPIYIVNAINLPKHSFETLQGLRIGMVIVDECHLILTKIFSQALFYLCPRYLLGLSATPYRMDGFNQLFDMYFGIARIHKSLYKPHQVLCVNSKISIEHEITKNGNINWNSVIDRQADSPERLALICKYVREYPNRNVLILCKRIKQMNALYKELVKTETVSVFKESDSHYDKNVRVLISSYQKVGTGFSHDKLDMLILGSDTEEYFLQYLGRVFRRQDSSPLIIDIVDDHSVLWKHYRTRAKVYRECGGKIKKIK